MNTSYPHSGNIYSAQVLEFLTVATEFCQLVEHCQISNVKEFIAQALRILPTLYAKGLATSTLPTTEDEWDIEEMSEAQYDYVREAVAETLGSQDDYLDVFVEEMKYSDKPILKTISEDLADVYQVVGTFLLNQQNGNDEFLDKALARVGETFKEYWGGRLLSALRALHDLYTHPDEETEVY